MFRIFPEKNFAISWNPLLFANSCPRRPRALRSHSLERPTLSLPDVFDTPSNHEKREDTATSTADLPSVCASERTTNVRHEQPACDTLNAPITTNSSVGPQSEPEEQTPESVPEPWDVPDMAAATTNRSAPPSFPVHVLDPQIAEWLALAALGAGSPIDYTAVTFLVIAASLIGASRRISPWSSWNETPILWACLVGSPSSNKSPGADPVLQILRELETEMALDYPRVLREWTTQCETARHVKEAWQKDVRTAVGLGNPPPVMPATAEEPDQPQRPRLLVSDVTPEKLGELLVSNQRGLLCHRDEFAGWFNSFGRYSGMGGAERAFWLECYGGRSYSIDRIKSPAPIVIPYLAVSLLGGTQPDRLTDLLNSPDDGLQARMLWVFPDKVPRRRPTCDISAELPTKTLRRLAGLSFTIDDDGQSRPVICRLDDSAAQNFEAWWCEHGKVELSGLLGSIHGKAPGLVLRLALVLAHLRWAAGPESVPPPNSIDASTVDAAIVLATDYFQPMAKRVLCDAELPENERLAMILGRWIQEKQPHMINARETRRMAKLPGLREAANMDKACEELCNAGWLRPVPTRAGSTAGRPRKDFEVNPKVLTNHKA